MIAEHEDQYEQQKNQCSTVIAVAFGVAFVACSEGQGRGLIFVDL